MQEEEEQTPLQIFKSAKTAPERISAADDLSGLKDNKKYPIGNGLYLKALITGNASWIYRYSFGGKRKEYTFADYTRYASKKGSTLSQAENKVAEFKVMVRQGLDPQSQTKSRLPSNDYETTVDYVAQEWLRKKQQKIQSAHIHERVYKNDIKPAIGGMQLTEVKTSNIMNLVSKINNSGRPSIANDALHYCKQIFKLAQKMDLIQFDPTQILSAEDAGGTEKPRERKLSFDELEIVFKVLRQHKERFTRDNYIALCLLTALGIRKNQLLQAPWHEFDLEKKIWRLPKKRAMKNSPAIEIPLAPPVLVLLDELKIRSNNSAYLFPPRRTSKSDFVCENTLNHAVAAMFGKKVRANSKSLSNVFAEYHIEEFVPHDLRHSGRTLLSELGASAIVGEKFLNHKLKGVLGIYDHHSYFEERKTVMEKLANRLQEIW
ncbi:site-specific integrase [Pseudoalteromonas sp. PAR1]|uniref:tyrosine-type recombinase/integrase n=1 Tax=Pseudoalteromonas sp. PAR1 TaxID=2853443 RepID=UPI00248B604E|nr:site-specific integrase [Pseudoalteromonas sp. PAR1]